MNPFRTFVLLCFGAMARDLPEERCGIVPPAPFPIRSQKDISCGFRQPASPGPARTAALEYVEQDGVVLSPPCGRRPYSLRYEVIELYSHSD